MYNNRKNEKINAEYNIIGKAFIVATENATAKIMSEMTSKMVAKIRDIISNIKATNTLKTTTTSLFLSVLVVMIIGMLFSVNLYSEPSLVWKHTYPANIQQDSIYARTNSHFVNIPTNPNRLLAINTKEIYKLVPVDCFWEITLLDANTGEIIGEPVTFDARNFSAYIGWFIGLGTDLRNYTYFLEGNTLNFFAGGLLSWTMNNNLWFINFKIHITDNGLILDANSTDINPPASLTDGDTLSVFLKALNEDLYCDKDFNLIGRTLSPIKETFHAKRLDNVYKFRKIYLFDYDKYEVRQMWEGSTGYYNLPKMDTIAEENLFEGVKPEGISDYLKSKWLSDYFVNGAKNIDIDDTLTAVIVPLYDSTDLRKSTECLIGYYNRYTGVFYDKIYMPLNSEENISDFIIRDNVLYTISYASGAKKYKITKRSIFSDDITSSVYENYNIRPYDDNPLLKGRSGLLNIYIYDDSTFYLYKTINENNYENNYVYLAKYNMPESPFGSFAAPELLWEEQWESNVIFADGLYIKQQNILVNDNDIYLKFYYAATNSDVIPIDEYFKITDKPENIKEQHNTKTLMNIKIVPNPTEATSTLMLDLKTAGNLHIILSNTLGQDLFEIHNNFETEGTFSKTFSIEALPVGVYFIKINHNGNFKIEKVIRK
jgi:hypothetical protein